MSSGAPLQPVLPEFAHGGPQRAGLVKDWSNSQVEGVRHARGGRGDLVVAGLRDQAEATDPVEQPFAGEQIIPLQAHYDYLFLRLP